MEPSKPKPGRPIAPDDKKLISKSMRFTAGQWAKIDEAGRAWLRALVDAAPIPKKKPPEGGSED